MGIKIKARAGKLVRVYCTLDESIDEHASQIDQYMETHDEKYLTFVPKDPDVGEYGPVEWWGQPPDWESFEPVFWRCLGDVDAMSRECFRLSVKEFKNLKIENDEGKIVDFPCIIRNDPSEGARVMVAETFEAIPDNVRRNVGWQYMVLGGVASRAQEFTEEIREKFNKQMRVVPGELEKN